jgi:hypothetical protein
MNGILAFCANITLPIPEGQLSFHARHARGMMARWTCDHHIREVKTMQGFDPDESDAYRWRFGRL